MRLRGFRRFFLSRRFRRGQFGLKISEFGLRLGKIGLHGVELILAGYVVLVVGIGIVTILGERNLSLLEIDFFLFCPQSLFSEFPFLLFSWLRRLG